jgi:hypothetical protein
LSDAGGALALLDLELGLRGLELRRYWIRLFDDVVDLRLQLGLVELDEPSSFSTVLPP